jgi:hypothetical protein
LAAVLAQVSAAQWSLLIRMADSGLPPDGDDFPGIRRATICHIRAVAQVSEVT